MADVYRPADGKPRAAVVLFLGANAAGRDDPDVINLGSALARAGYVAMFHWSPTMALRANIEPAETGNLVSAYQYLSEREYVDPERTGLGGFCVGASFALVAAADPRIRDDVHFVNAFGPYFDAGDLLLQAASRSVLYDGERTDWEPDRLTMRVLANELIETLDNPQDVDSLTRRYMNNQALSPDELEALSPQARTVSSLLDGTTPEKAGILYEELPADFRQAMADVSPSTHIDSVQARAAGLARPARPVGARRRVAQAAGCDRRAGRRPLHRGPVIRARAAGRERDWRAPRGGIASVSAHVQHHSHRPVTAYSKSPGTQLTFPFLSLQLLPAIDCIYQGSRIASRSGIGKAPTPGTQAHSPEAAGALRHG